ncbi:hypothetical protein EMIHUDRAFT_228523 [Emiliania huxleyi CCMP1516]|uniref:Uncharacterized protein n=2 Tax=Emiliania huxleyi TaxID=2903 RepID=A0A0D3KFL1_EMIH1|nr:hypothetical protein EMIHUDRAFT_228523 [Emiliania huxleyi CCMP1516]EOD34546.1 hypothetical protein EMIHUDRAFT_228523 [Emiliania huxleyi CCMP1516]|eukprot:XP_005786975.1 hypothetical protein EMIHUDRAFT_228523 [Emiliania huxleyi CCMP1516]
MYHPDDLPLRATLERRDSDLQLSPRTGTSRISSLLASPIRSIGKQPPGSRLRQPATRTLAVLLVEARKPGLRFWDLCDQYLRLPLDTPKSQRCSAWRVPKLYHAVGKDASPPPAVVGNAARNPDFQLRYLGDEAAAEYVKARCGEAAHAAYQCFVAPAYRADLFRYCALHADGGVYLDTDIMLAVSIPEAVDMCDGATLGHDIPQLPLPPHRLGDAVVPGMQMKILGGEPGHPLFKCMLDGIIGHVTGPSLLADCYRQTLLGDSTAERARRRGAVPTENYAPGDLDGDKRRSEEVALKKLHYHELMIKGVLYSDSCPLERRPAL